MGGFLVSGGQCRAILENPSDLSVDELAASVACDDVLCDQRAMVHGRGSVITSGEADTSMNHIHGMNVPEIRVVMIANIRQIINFVIYLFHVR